VFLRSGFVIQVRKGGESVVLSLSFLFVKKVQLFLLLQHLVKIKTRKRSWMMRVTARQPPSQHSWGPPYGTKLFPMTEILFSWNTWTWRSFCRKMVSPRAHLSMTTALTLQGCSRLLLLPPQSWTSAAGLLHPFTLASHLQTVCRAPSDQVNSQRFSLQ
jgi:hypothetical protein